jgi:hypothetical protein
MRGCYDIDLQMEMQVHSGRIFVQLPSPFKSRGYGLFFFPADFEL